MAKRTPPVDHKSRTPSKSPKVAPYPLMVTERDEGGRVTIKSNEDGNQWTLVAHPSGSYTMHHPDGSVTSVTPGDSVSHSKGGMTVSVDHNNNVKVAGHNTLNVQGGGHIEVAGAVNMVAAGAVSVVALGGFGAAIKGAAYIGASEGINMNAPSVKIKGDDFKVTAKMELNGDISHKGDMVTSGVHTDSTGKHVG